MELLSSANSKRHKAKSQPRSSATRTTATNSNHFHGKLPHPSRTLEDLAENDPKLYEVLSQDDTTRGYCAVSPSFDKLYKNKIEYLRERLNRLDLVLSRHNFYDCETILELQDPDTGRKALLMQGDMDLNSDGSDGDEIFAIDATSHLSAPNQLPLAPNSRIARIRAFRSMSSPSLKQEFSRKRLPA